MSWTKTTHEGRGMWERNGERVHEVPDERHLSYPSDQYGSPAGNAMLACFVFGLLIGVVAGLIIGSGAAP